MKWLTKIYNKINWNDEGVKTIVTFIFYQAVMGGLYFGGVIPQDTEWYILIWPILAYGAYFVFWLGIILLMLILIFAGAR